MGADIGDKISSQPDRQDCRSLFLAILLLRLSLFLQSCTVSQEELGQDREKEQAGDNLDTQEYGWYKNRWLLFVHGFPIDLQFGNVMSSSREWKFLHSAFSYRES